MTYGVSGEVEPNDSLVWESDDREAVTTLLELKAIDHVIGEGHDDLVDSIQRARDVQE